MITYRQPFKGEYPITQKYGEIIEGVTYKGRPHTGIDYGCPEGTPILASADGTVVFCGEEPTGYGKYVIISHDSTHATLYAHLSSRSVSVGQQVKQGNVIGQSGNTGNSTGPHLHFEARSTWNGWSSHFDPMTLPLQSVDDAVAGLRGQSPRGQTPELKGADSFHEGDVVKVAAPLGCKAFLNDHFDYASVYPQGSEFYYTGQTMQHNGYTYMRVIPMTKPVLIAVNDGETQILE